MVGEASVGKDRDFIQTCLQLELLDETDAESLRKSVGADSKLITQTVLQRGLLTPADVDIVQSLQHPTQVVPGYKILDLIGRGGMGVVYRAEQLDLEKIVALKTILMGNIHDPTIAARFEREAKSLAKLQHPNIVQALNFGKHEGRYYFAMEFVPGLTCEQALRETGIMPPSRAWSIVRQVASGLLHAMTNNLIHRDIKPANLLLLPAPEGSTHKTEIVKIADFGLAMFADQSPEHLKITVGDKIMGSPVYMSLEQFRGRQVDFRSDMYSLGATAWHLLYGSPPFMGSSVAALFEEKSRPLVVDPAALPVELPENQVRLLVGLLDPDPNQRPHSYQHLIDAIDALGVCVSESTLVVRPRTDANNAKQVSISAQETIDQVRTPEQISSQPQAAINDTIAQSTDRSGSSIVAQKIRARWLIAGIMIGSLLLLIAFFSFNSTKPGPRTHTRIAGTTPLFDGVTLSGWDVGGSMVGAWNTVEAPDSSTAIACTTRQGALTRRIPETSNPRISLFVWLRPDGGPVDVDFAFDPTDPSDVRATLRMTGTANLLGEKVSDFGELDVAIESPALPTVYDRYHVIHVERQPTDWYVFMEDQLIGTLPIKKVGNGNAIRLVVHGSEQDADESHVFFADVQLYDLRQDKITAPK